MARRGVVLLSGGLDSTVLLTKLINEGYDCFPLSVEYGQRHSKEVYAASKVSEALKVRGRWQCLDLVGLHDLIHSALSGHGEIPDGHYSDEVQKATVFPNRNMILLAAAAGYAETIDGSFVAYAAHSNDRAVYPDCRPEFVASVATTLWLGTGGKVRLIEPFVDETKASLVTLGLKVGAPLGLTWSCYKGQRRPCGTCGTCLERTEAFVKARYPDPALTSEEWEMFVTYLGVYSGTEEAS